MSEQTSFLADAEKRQAALSSVVWSLLLTALKLVAGLATNSLGLLSEALHSALDLVAAGITYLAVRVSSRPADRHHPYGYGKIENLSALVETILLLVTCVWIVHEAFDRLFFSSPVITHSWWGVGVIVISIVVDISRARMLKRVAKKHNSQALEADALHFSTDILSSCVVLVGLMGLWAASLLPDGPLRDLLEKTDAFAALVVSGIVVYVGSKLLRRAVHVLLDGGGEDHALKLEQALAAQLPVYSVRKLRVRESGSAIFADVTLGAPGDISLEAGHHISSMVEDIAREIMPGADVTVHVEPAGAGETGLLATVHAVGAAHGLAVHSLVLDDSADEGPCCFLHVETPGEMSLAEAHQRVDSFEASLRRRIGAANIVSHIEPAERHAEGEGEGIGIPPQDIERAVMRLFAEDASMPPPHDMEIRTVAGLVHVCFHCTVPGSLSVARTHDLATDMERRLKSRVTGIDRITIHMEPEDGNIPPHGHTK